tara:strand:- start:878 stop:1153 length:276 start_codon:yes stop_codon:yes gene_type:complete
MVKARQDVMKVEILMTGVDTEVHYIEKSGKGFLYTFIGDSGQGLVHQVKADELETFVHDLYQGFQDFHGEETARKVNVEEDWKEIKTIFNV